MSAFFSWLASSGKWGLRFFFVANVVLVISSAHAQVIDQIFVGSDASQSHVGGSVSEFAQTFTVGIDGKLAMVSAKLLSRQQLNLELRRVVNEVPSRDPADLLGIVARVTPVAKDWTDFDVNSLGIEVERGDRLAMVLVPTFPNNGDLDWRAGFDPNLFPIINPTADYLGGSGLAANLNGDDRTWRPASPTATETDFFFRTLVHPVPEPNTISLSFLSFILLQRLRLQRRSLP